MNKKVLMAVGSNYYTSPFFQLGSHHFARAFEKMGYEVLFIATPISPIHKLLPNRKDLPEKERIHKTGGERIGNITHYVPKAIIVPRNRVFFSSKFVINNWYRFSTPNILDFIKQKKFDDVDILWFDNAMFGFLLDKIKYTKSVLRIADYNKYYSSTSKNQLEKETEIANRVDKVIYTAKNLKEKHPEIKDKSKMQYVPNGIDIDFFKNADKSFPEEYAHIPTPIIVYIGAILEWFDVELVCESAKAMPSCSFVLIGPVQKDLSMLKKLKNVFLMGGKPYSKIFQFLHNAQVGIIPFDIKDHLALIESVHPLKLYEYMAAGLPVVSTRWEEIEYIKSPAYLASSKEEFIRFLKLALSSGKKNTYKKFAQNHDWSQRIKSIMK